MTAPPQPLRIDTESLKRTIQLSTLVASYGIKLRSNGKELLGLCPFHQETTPSFTITPATNLYRCFGCEASGDIFKFVSAIDNIPATDFRAIARRVCERAGVDVPTTAANGLHVAEPAGKLVDTYDYTDESGALLYQVQKFERGSGATRKKNFVQRKASGERTLDGVRRVLYRLPAVLAASTVLLCEGEKDVHTCERLGYVATTNSGGAHGKLPDDFDTVLAGKHIIILPDNDTPGLTRGERLLERLRPVAASVVLARIPDPAKDITEYVEAGATRQIVDDLIRRAGQSLDEQIEAAVRSADAVEAMRLVPQIARLDGASIMVAKTSLATGLGRDFKPRDFDAAIKAEKHRYRQAAKPQHLPAVAVNGRPLRDVTGDALRALVTQNDPPTLFVRTGEMSFIAMDEADRPTIAPVNESHLRGRLDRSANYVRETEDGAKPCHPPIEVVRDILHACRGEWKLPALAGVVEMPTMRPDGSILDVTGYDASTGMFYAPPAELRTLPVTDKPTAVETRAAVDLIDDVLADFPFADDASRANTFGLLLTPILRPALKGCTPLALIDAPDAGTGKSLLARVCSLITTGREASMTPFPRDEAEMQKQIGAFLMGGRPVVIFDNLDGVLDSPNLALVMTAREFEARILGFSRNMSVPNNSTWVVTGNNIRPAGDMPRRCYQIRLDARISNPFQGREFRHADLIGHISRNRSELLHALLTIARSWYASGKRCAIEDAIGSFEEWHRTVGSILAHAGVIGFLGNYRSWIAEEDEPKRQWEAFLLAVAELYPDECSFTTNALAERILQTAELRRELPDSLIEAAEKPGKFQRMLGSQLGQRRDKRLGGVRLTRAPKVGRTNHTVWRVVVD